MGPDSRFGSFGLCFGPNRRFSTHFGQNLMFFDPTKLWPMWPLWPNGTRGALTDDSMDPCRCATDIRNHMGRLGTLTSPDETKRDPT